MSPIEYDCHHEELLQNHSLKLKELETEVEYKKEKIDNLNMKIDKLEEKIDKQNEKLDTIIQKSIEDDNNIDKRVTSLETTVKVLKWGTGLLFGSGIIWILFNIIH